MKERCYKGFTFEQLEDGTLRIGQEDPMGNHDDCVIITLDDAEILVARLQEALADAKAKAPTR